MKSVIERTLESTKGEGNHISIYIWKKTREEIKALADSLPEDFYVTDDALDRSEHRWLSLNAENIAGFKYVGITIYLEEMNMEVSK